ncbi:MAG: type II toxin-antitoxin system RelE/ParE family toxin [Tagaea sp.]
MRYAVEFALDAEGDLEALAEYIAARDGEARAEAMLTRIADAVARRASFPERRNVPPELAASGSREFLEIHARPYRIVYTIDGARVVVLVVVDSRRDVANALAERLARG